MKKLQMLTFCAFSALCLMSCADMDDVNTVDPYSIESSEEAIINGIQVTNDDYKGTVVIAYKPYSKHYAYCTGTLIAEDWVLTAGHCVSKCEDDSEDFIGEYQKATYIGIGNDVDKLSKSYKAAEFYVHPNFICSTRDIRNDIGLIKLSTKVPESVVKPVYIINESNAPTIAEIDNVGLSSTTVGFGKTNANDSNSTGIKFKLTRNVGAICAKNFNSAGCKTTYAYYKDYGFVFYPKGDKTTCNGDSGGPTFITRDGVDYQIGVTSWGAGENCAGITAMTYVGAYLDFIKQYVTLPSAASTGVSAEQLESLCSDGIDNNSNSLIDCDDPACNSASVCAATHVADSDEKKMSCSGTPVSSQNPLAALLAMIGAAGILGLRRRKQSM